MVVKAILRNRAAWAVTNEQYRPISRQILRAYCKIFIPCLLARLHKHLHHRQYLRNNFAPRFVGDLDYAEQKAEPFFIDPATIKANKKVSVLIRTCGRPDVLREALTTLRQQTYPNLEIVIVEDGENRSEQMLKTDFADLPIKYKATGHKVGRSRSGNLALKLATGDYCNFLDDDDAFYPDHVATLVNFAEQHHQKIVYSTAFETGIVKDSISPYRYHVHYVALLQNGNFSRIRLCKKNLFPIQSVLFHRDVYKKCGGFDEQLDGLEDWDLWLNYAMHYDFSRVAHTTSVYRVPAQPQEVQSRAAIIEQNRQYLLSKWQHQSIPLTFKDFHDEDL